VLNRAGATLVACCLIVVGLAPVAAAADPGFTVTEHRIDVVDGPDDDQDVTIDASLFVPDGVDGDNPAPVVINAHGFNGSKATNDNGMNEILAGAGYVVFAYSSRGFGETTGKIGLDSVDYDVKDVRQLIDWLAERPEVLVDDAAAKDPRLGMVGPSYGGGIQLQTAGVDDRIDVIVPFITWHSLVSSLSPNYLNTDLRLQEGRPIGVFKEQWTSLFFASGNAQPLTSPQGSGIPVPCPNFVDPLCRIYTESVLAGRA
jgi:ABC-2 type transport system ATP-binding protein